MSAGCTSGLNGTARVPCLGCGHKTPVEEVGIPTHGGLRLEHVDENPHENFQYREVRLRCGMCNMTRIATPIERTIIDRPNTISPSKSSLRPHEEILAGCSRCGFAGSSISTETVGSPAIWPDLTPVWKCYRPGCMKRYAASERVHRNTGNVVADHPPPLCTSVHIDGRPMRRICRA